MFRHTGRLQFESRPEKPDPVYAHKLQELSGMDPQQAIVSGGGALLADSNGYPWNGRYIVASGNLLADFRANVAAEAQGRLQTGSWASGPQPDGQHEFGYLAEPEPLGDVAAAPAPDPALYATYDGAMGEPSGPALGTETGLAGKIKDALT